MAKIVHELDHSHHASASPLIGALLRLPFMSARTVIVEQLHAVGFTDLLPAHLAVFQHPGPHGRSPGAIARSANVSKQAMNNLLAQLERAGYLIRVVNPDNRRNRQVMLTPQGEEAIQAIRTAVQHIEQGWERDLGARSYEQLRSLLVRLNEVVAARAGNSGALPED